MNQERLKAAIADYKGMLEADPGKIESDLNERAERINLYQSYAKDQILNFKLDDLVEYLGRLWAFRIWGNKRGRVEKIVADNGSVEDVCRLIVDLLFGSDEIATRWDRFLDKAKGLGSAAASELLTYNNPKEMAILNGTTVDAFEYLEVPIHARYAMQRDGACYLKICESSQEIRAALQSADVPAEDLLAVDYFLWDVVKPEKKRDSEEAEQAASSSKGDKKTSSRKKSDSYHSEVQTALEEIGVFLGFDSSTEVKVADGAVVDAVWEATIGNMGKVIYVFEVQSYGSVDSLILNLTKAQSNPAVQAIVAVSDEEQLQRIGRESRGVIPDGILKTWQSDDVLETRDNLSNAYDSINALGLVPESF